MGVTASIIGTLGMAFAQGYAQKQQANAMARQAEANADLQQRNAQIMAQNSEKAQQNAEETARVNAQNTENERRKMLLRLGQQKAAIGSSGITATGSALNALADTQWDIDKQTAINLYNGRQETDKFFGQANDYSNQSAQYAYSADVERENARNYRAAGKRAMMTSLLSGAISAGLQAWGAGGSSAGGKSSVAKGPTPYDNIGKSPGGNRWQGLPTYRSSYGTKTASLRL